MQTADLGRQGDLSQTFPVTVPVPDADSARRKKLFVAWVAGLERVRDLRAAAGRDRLQSPKAR
jgi:hypothetical protein